MTFSPADLSSALQVRLSQVVLFDKLAGIQEAVKHAEAVKSNSR